MALAHIDAEIALEAALPLHRAGLCAPTFVQAIHGELYGRLPVADRVNDHDASVKPGAWRESLVTAGRHLAPEPADIDALLARGSKPTRGCLDSSKRWWARSAPTSDCFGCIPS